MTKTIKLYLHQKLDVRLLADEEYYQSSVQELDETSLSITIPLRRHGQQLLLLPGEKVLVEFAVDDAIYRFDSVVLKRAKSNNVPLIVLKRPASYTRRQRRSFVRLPVVLPVEYRVLGQKDQEGLPQISDTFSGKTIDISGGGIQLSASQPANRGDTILLTLHLDDGNAQKLSLAGEVCRVNKDQHTGAVRLGVGFLQINEQEQERIVAYIFSKMRQRTQS